MKYKRVCALGMFVYNFTFNIIYHEIQALRNIKVKSVYIYVLH